MGIVAAVFLVKAVVLALWVTPLWDVPDETGHYGIVADLADGKGLPLPGRSVLPPDVASDWAKGRVLSTEEKWNWVAQHPPLYDLAAVPFLAAARTVTTDAHWRYRAPRLLSALSGAAAVLFLFAVFREASGDPLFAFAAASAVSFLPMFSHMSSGTNHDTFLALLCAAAALFWVRLWHGGRFSDGMKMALALSAACFTKFSALVVAAVLLVLSWRALPARGIRRAAQWIAIAAVSFSLPVLWTLRQGLLLGNVRMHPVSKHPFDLGSFLSYLRANPVVDHTLKNFVGLIGWTSHGAGRVEWFQISGVFFLFAVVIALAAAAGAVVWFWRSDPGPGRLPGRIAAVLVFLGGFLWLFSGAEAPDPARRLLYSLLAAAPLLALPRLLLGREDPRELIPAASQAVFLVFAIAYLVNSWEAHEIYGAMRATNGRYFFAVLPWIALAFAWPAVRLMRPGTARRAVLLALPAAMFVNEALFFLLRAIPFYRRPS
jgi:dolichyl-phosphate-mannose-protein mannosyltransferase